MNIRKAKLVGLFFVPVLLSLIPLDMVENGDTLCLYKNLTGGDCYGCGITRACFNFLHLNFEKALDFNKGVIVVFPLMVYAWISQIVGQITKLKNQYI